MIETEDPQEKIRANIAAYQAAIKAGTHTQQDLDDYLSEVHEHRTGKPFVSPTPDTSETMGDRAMGMLGTAYQGATFGRGDKVIAALQTLGKAQAGQVHGFAGARDDFNANRADTRKVLDDYHGRHPTEANAVDLAGSLPTLMVGGGGLASVGRRAASALPESVPAVARAVAREIPGARRIERVGRAVRSLGSAAPAAEAVVPQAEGLIGNGMDSVLEAVKARGVEPIAARAPSRTMDLADQYALTAEHIRKGGTLNSVKNAFPTYAGRYVKP